MLRLCGKGVELLQRCIMSLVPVKAPRALSCCTRFLQPNLVVKLWPGSECACHGGGWMTKRMQRGCLGGAAPRPLHPFRRFVSRIRGDATPESRRSGTCTYPRAFSRTLSTSAPSTETWARTRPCAASTSASEMPIPRAPQLLEARIRRQIAARTRNIPTQACRLRPRGSAPPSLRGPAMTLC